MFFSCVNFQCTGRSRHASTTRPLTDSPADTPRECARGRPDNRPVWLCTECAQCKDITQCSEVSEKSSNRSFYPKIIAQKYLDYDTVGHARVSSTYPRSHQLLGFFSCYVPEKIQVSQKRKDLTTKCIEQNLFIAVRSFQIWLWKLKISIFVCLFISLFKPHVLPILQKENGPIMIPKTVLFFTPLYFSVDLLCSFWSLYLSAVS